MAGQRFLKLNRGSDNAKPRRRRHLVVLAAAADSFLAAARAVRAARVAWPDPAEAPAHPGSTALPAKSAAS
jgi:hypothetical protein